MEHQGDSMNLLDQALSMVGGWEAGFVTSPVHPSLNPDPDRLAAAWEEFSRRMQGNYPFFHPSFAGQMLKPPHPVAVAAYVATMLINPNNQALDGGPVTSGMEREVATELADMFGLPAGALGHLTTSGTIANLEALWVARRLAPGKRIVFGSNAHYTHARMCEVLGVPSTEVGVDAAGRIDLDAVEECCRAGDVAAVVLTAGTTGLGTVDPIDAALDLRERYGVRLHVDSAYGGFFTILARAADPDPELHLPLAALRAIASCDSVVVDPHKHGLQPYGCGAVLFADPDVGRLYRHDSPYTYYTSADMHLGEISLECSRAGAAAAALWFTLRCLPLDAETGLGPILAAGRRAALAWSGRLADDGDSPDGAGLGPLRRHVVPELDIVTYFPWRPGATADEVDAASRQVLADGMAASSEPVWLSLLRVDPETFSRIHPDIPPSGRAVSVLRSVLMKPEHEMWVDHLHRRVGQLADAAWSSAA